LVSERSLRKSTASFRPLAIVPNVASEVDRRIVSLDSAKASCRGPAMMFPTAQAWA
jgi:hypothetical protein